MKHVFSLPVAALLFRAGWLTRTVPSLIDAEHASDRSSEPVLFQSFPVDVQSDQPVKDAIIRDATARQRNATDLDDGPIQTKRVNRSSGVTLWFSRGKGRIRMNALSDEMDEMDRKAMEWQKPALTEGWIRNLHNAFPELFGLLHA